MRIASGKHAALLAASALLLTGVAADGFAQMAGGGGHGGGGRHGQQAPRHDTPRPDSAPASAPDPLATFFLDLRSLREELMIRQEQVDAWVGMREALRSYVELAPADGATSGSPLQALRARVERSRKVADALQEVDTRVGTLLPMLDTRQRPLFESRLAAAFAADR